MMYIDIPEKMNAGVSVGRDNNLYMFQSLKQITSAMSLVLYLFTTA